MARQPREEGINQLLNWLNAKYLKNLRPHPRYVRAGSSGQPIATQPNMERLELGTYARISRNSVIDKIEEPLKGRITRYGMKVVSTSLKLDTPKSQLEVVEEVLKLTSFRDVVESLEYKAKKEVDGLKKGFKKFVGGLRGK